MRIFLSFLLAASLSACAKPEVAGRTCSAEQQERVKTMTAICYGSDNGNGTSSHMFCFSAAVNLVCDVRGMP